MAASREMQVRLETIVGRTLVLLQAQGVRPEDGLLITMALILHRVRHTDAPSDASAKLWNRSRHARLSDTLEHVLRDMERELDILIDRPRLPPHVVHNLLDMIDDSIAAIPRNSLGPLPIDQFEMPPLFAEGVQTPSSVASLMVQILDPKPGSSLLDPACGSGGLLLASLEHLKRRHIKGTLGFTGVERQSHLAAFAKLNLALCGHLSQHVTVGDAFEITGSQLLGKFDYVLSNPPALRLSESEEWRLYRHPAFHFGPLLPTTDFNFIQLALAHLKPGGSGLLLVRHRPLMARGKEQEIRRQLLEAGCIRAVISLPSRLLPTTSAACAILVLQAPARPPTEPSVTLIAADAEFGIDDRGRRVLTAANIERIHAAVTAEPIKGFSAVKRMEDLAKANYVLTPATHVDTGESPVTLGPSAVMKRIESVAQVLQGPALGGLPPGSVPILRGRNLRLRHIREEALVRKDTSTQPKLLKTVLGDILVQRLGKSPCAYYVGQDLANIAVSNTVYVVRLHQANELTARFIVQFLNSSTGRQRLRPNAGTVPTLSKSALGAVEIPIADESIMRLALGLDDLETLVHKQAALVSELKTRLFNVSDAEQFPQAFTDLKLSYRVIRESLLDSGKLATLNATLGAAALEEALSLWEQHQTTDDESFWHGVLDERPFLFAQLFHYPVVIVQNHAYVGGKKIDNRHGSIADFLAKTKTTNSALIIEIKTPCTALLGPQYRQDIYPWSRDLSGSLSQVLHYQSSLSRNILQLRDDTEEPLESDTPRGIVIAGNVSKELDSRAKRRSFEHLRERLHGVSVVGFDELFGRARGILEAITMRNASS
jgi:tRNA1(Val) A37 N6-methylase TrmN6